MRHLEQANSWRQKGEGWFPWAGGGVVGSCFVRTEFQFFKMKEFWGQMVVIAAQQCECTLKNG